ncbi:MAG: hypothetical protein JXN59_08820 [Anaerolineae bacterium]|nr:hypothetical protein [Anaerolineae bacterium]
MARKKTRNANISEEALARARREAAGESYVPPAQANQRQSSAQALTSNAHKTTHEDLAEEYGYVLTDLRNMAILAAALFAVLIVLSFIL